ncbi:MAG: D-alanyl-D-alanine carboxypeptidase family protein, partial [Pseudomonadota bacterium]|nr:D-alanyl-D-alanine carboxypeptidase family protein [Pseudomonadota bacterium]MEE2996541.1 D-alanyl-D-alanine carboxypeptidase family protein [Pseudomonadota bacterium]
MRKSFLTTATLSFLALTAGGIFPAVCQTMQTPARNAFILDMSTNTVLFTKEADIETPPASMSKLMTIYMVFERLKKGLISLDDEFPVSRKAWRKGGSKMFVLVGDKVKVSDLLRGIIVQSGNDACIVIAEALGGTEEAFAAMMTKKARELGMENSRFANATGWPDPDHRMSARDLAKLTQILVTEFPNLYKIFAETTFTYGRIKQGNRNPLLYRDVGADGLKTGHTVAAGYGLTASALRGNRRIILVLNGMKSRRQRSQESLRLLEWAFRSFKPYALFEKDEEVIKADVWLGTAAEVPLIVPETIQLTLPHSGRDKMKVSARMTNPVAAPITKGQRLGTLVITVPGRKT